MRGPTDDVLARFVQAIHADDADTVVRVCADNPFIDPVCVDQLVREFRQHGAEYAFNHRPYGSCNYSDGFGAEILSRELLNKLHKSNLSPQQREHVTLAVVDGTVPARIHACIAPTELAHPELRFDVDLAEDIAYLAKLIERHHFDRSTSAADFIRGARSASN
jgi:spore coat polysaccharide biosynthesis protein SpsF